MAVQCTLVTDEEVWDAVKAVAAALMEDLEPYVSGFVGAEEVRPIVRRLVGVKP